MSKTLKKPISELSASSGMSIETIAQRALKHYVDLNTEKIHDLQLGIEAADRGDFASATKPKRRLRPMAHK